MTKIAIIGAGFSGLVVANLLQNVADITLFEKSRGVGGRISTRYGAGCHFDHGAQYFTARTKSFQEFIRPLIEKGEIKRWAASYVKFKSNKIIERKSWGDDEPRYVGVPGMNQVGKFLSKGLEIKINTRIVSIQNQGKWFLVDEYGKQYEGFDWVICTAPAPQATKFLPKSFKYHDNMVGVEMLPCFTLMLGLKKQINLGFEAAHVTDSDVRWIAVNSKKPQRAPYFTLVVHSSAEYAQAHIDYECEQVIENLIAKTSNIVGYDLVNSCYKDIHRWRYAYNANSTQSPLVLIDRQNKLASCGDWVMGGRVEGAFTSACNLVLEIQKVISNV